MSMLRLLQTNLLLTCLVLAILLAIALLVWAVFRSDKSKTQAIPRNIKEEELQAKLVNAFLDLSLQPRQNQAEESLSHSLSLYLMADLLGFLRYEPHEKQLSLIAPYDLIREEHNRSSLLRVENLPHLFQKLASHEPLISNDEHELKGEKAYLMEAISYNQLGNLLLYPLKSVPNQPEWAILALSPYTNKAWQESELEKLDHLQTQGKSKICGLCLLNRKKKSQRSIRLLLNLKSKRQNSGKVCKRRKKPGKSKLPIGLNAKNRSKRRWKHFKKQYQLTRLNLPGLKTCASKKSNSKSD